MYAINLIAGKLDQIITGESEKYGAYAYVQMLIKRPKGRMEVVDLRFPDNFDTSSLKEGDIWQFAVDVYLRREGDRVVGISRYVVNDGDSRKLNRKLGAGDLPGIAPPKAA